MQMLNAIILRHRRENLKKCSLRGLEAREDFLFLTYPKDPIPDCAEGSILLTLDAPLLTREEKPLFILDATWRYAEKMHTFVTSQKNFVYRSLPKELRTAYPRRQEDCACPERGLASIEAIYAAFHILGKDTSGLLDHYHWKDLFLEINHEVLVKYAC